MSMLFGPLGIGGLPQRSPMQVACPQALPANSIATNSQISRKVRLSLSGTAAPHGGAT